MVLNYCRNDERDSWEKKRGTIRRRKEGERERKGKLVVLKFWGKKKGDNWAIRGRIRKRREGGRKGKRLWFWNTEEKKVEKTEKKTEKLLERETGRKGR